jgi:hypothetical protein
MDGDVTPGEIEAVTVAEIIDDKLTPVGEVQFGRRTPVAALEAMRLDRRLGLQCRCRGRAVAVSPTSVERVSGSLKIAHRRLRGVLTALNFPNSVSLVEIHPHDILGLIHAPAEARREPNLRPSFAVP